ncbi:MAG TPA: hypothetical protein VIQ74_10350 [Gemmatimonadaceae bacterium]
MTTTESGGATLLGKVKTTAPAFARTILRSGRPVLMGLGLLATVACNDMLRVEDPVNLTPDDLQEGSVALTVNGVRGAFQSMFDYYVMHTAILTDEMILAGTFPYRAEMDARSITANNEGLLGDLYTPLSTARFMADTAVAILDAAAGGGGDETERLNGVALSKYYAAYTRMLLAEAFCQSAINGGPGLSSDERMADALTAFQDAGTAAQAAGLADLVAASKLGEARANLWLGQYPAAASAASAVPATGFSFKAYYSTASVAQKNKITRLTYAIDEARRFTVGDGSLNFTGHEKWAYFDEWESLGLIEERPDLTSFNAAVPVVLQLKYPTADAPIVMASSEEARLIEAELKLRDGAPGDAANIVNSLRSNWGLGTISFSGDLATDLPVMARERARELWLTGERLPTLRRYLKDGVDLFPGGKQGTDTCFPVPQRELDTNPNF